MPSPGICERFSGAVSQANLSGAESQLSDVAGSSIFRGMSPHRVVFRHNKMAVLRFDAEIRYRKPVVIVPALIGRPHVLDLYEGGSFIAALRAEGFDCFLIDWGIPGDEDARLSLGDLLLRYLPVALRAVREASGCEPLTLAGYCMGGTLAACHAAYVGWAAPNNFIALAAPLDFRNGGLLAAWCRKDYLDVDRIVEVFGNVPAHIVEAVFTLLRPTARVRAMLSYSARAHDPGADRAFRAMDGWVNDWIAFPGAAAKEWIERFYQRNELFAEEFTLGTKTLRMSQVTAPALIVAAPGDAIVPAASTKAFLTQLGGADKVYLEVSGGHIGMVAGKGARRELWPKVTDWLRTRSEAA